jgi:hypothetical protein
MNRTRSAALAGALGLGALLLAPGAASASTAGRDCYPSCPAPAGGSGLPTAPPTPVPDASVVPDRSSTTLAWTGADSVGLGGLGLALIGGGLGLVGVTRRRRA